MSRPHFLKITHTIRKQKDETSTIPTAISFNFATGFDGYRIGRL
jgi:hypothetical protein